MASYLGLEDRPAPNAADRHREYDRSLRAEHHFSAFGDVLSRERKGGRTGERLGNWEIHERTSIAHVHTHVPRNARAAGHAPWGVPWRDVQQQEKGGGDSFQMRIRHRVAEAAENAKRKALRKE